MFQRISIFLITAVIISGCSVNRIELNTRIQIKNENRTNILLPTGSLTSSTFVIDKGIKYTVGFTSMKKTIFISTADSNFAIKGLRVNDIIPSEYFDNFNYIPGWGYYVYLSNGWYAGFDFQKKPDKDSKINWFFKFKF